MKNCACKRFNPRCAVLQCGIDETANCEVVLLSHLSILQISLLFFHCPLFLCLAVMILVDQSLSLISVVSGY